MSGLFIFNTDCRIDNFEMRKGYVFRPVIFISYSRFTRGGGHSLITPIRVCAAQRGRNGTLRSNTGYPYLRRFLERSVLLQTHQSVKISAKK